MSVVGNLVYIKFQGFPRYWKLHISPRIKDKHQEQSRGFRMA
jgi:hypothetical protein